jgi:hypothetical protein
MGFFGDKIESSRGSYFSKRIGKWKTSNITAFNLVTSRKGAVERFLETGIAETACRDAAHGFMPLLCTTDRCHIDVVKQVLERGIKAKSDNYHGKIWLQYGMEVVELPLTDDEVDASLKLRPVIAARGRRKRTPGYRQVTPDNRHNRNLIESDSVVPHCVQCRH